MKRHFVYGVDSKDILKVSTTLECSFLMCICPGLVSCIVNGSSMIFPCSSKDAQYKAEDKW